MMKLGSQTRQNQRRGLQPPYQNRQAHSQGDRAPVTLPGFPILVIEIQTLFLEILILVLREILGIKILVKINVSSVCFAKCY